MSEPEQILAGKYRLIAELGRGGMAEVNLAVASGPAGFNKLVVIKQLRQNLGDDPDFLSMFLDEARLAARLNHPNVVHTYEVVAEGGQHFIAMEYLDGQPMHRVVREFGKSGGLPLPIYLRIICDALAGIHYAHELKDYDGTPLNVVHRDISPHNIFVTYEGQTKVVDFGIAKALNSSSETRSGVIKGKISYMSPEQSRSEALDRRSDLYAVGIMLWEAITGQRLWKGLADVTILQRLMVDQPVPSPLDVKPDASPALAAIAMKALAPKREDRYANALDMQSEIENVMLDLRLRANGRDIHNLLTQKFAAEQAEIRAVIDAQLRTIPSESSRIAKLSSLSQSQSLPGLGPLSSSSSDSNPQASAISTTGTENSTLGASLSVPPQSGSITNASLVAPKPPPSGRMRTGVVLLGLALVGAIGWGALSAKRTNAEVARPTAVEPPAAARVALNVRASPAEAKLFLDNEALPGNPYAGFRTRDGSRHTIRIEAEGYAPKTRPITFDADISLDLDLEKNAAEPAASQAKPDDRDPRRRTGRYEPPPAAPPRTADAPKTAEPPVTTPPVKKGAKVELDKDNPWR